MRKIRRNGDGQADESVWRMIKYVVVFILLVPGVVHGQYRFSGEGRIASERITMDLIFHATGEVTGLYASLSSSTRTALTGRIVEDHVLLTTVGESITPEKFDGYIIKSSDTMVGLAGQWSSPAATDDEQHSRDFSIYNRNRRGDLVTCREMEVAPGVAFSYTDLGSGVLSPVTIDFGCPKSIANQDFIQPLLAIAGEARNPATSSAQDACQGASRHVQTRQFKYALAHLGYQPQGYAPGATSNRDDLEFFAEWGYSSLFNFEIYTAYLAASARAKPLLVAWYMGNHTSDAAVAEKYADSVLKVIGAWGFGSYPSNWVPKALVPFTGEAIAGNTEPFFASLANASDTQKINSLYRLLLSDVSEKVVGQLLAAIADAELTERSESPLSVAVDKLPLLTMLLDKGFDPNHQNLFGKTPLFYAIQRTQHEAAKRLIAAGADVNHGYQQAQEVDEAVCLDITHWGRTPYMHAAQHSDTLMLQILLDAGANPFARDVLNDIGLDYAERAGRPANVEHINKVLRLLPRPANVQP